MSQPILFQVSKKKRAVKYNFWHIFHQESGCGEMASRHFSTFQYSFLMIITCRKVCVLLMSLAEKTAEELEPLVASPWTKNSIKRGENERKEEMKMKCHTVCNCFFADYTAWVKRKNFSTWIKVNWKFFRTSFFLLFQCVKCSFIHLKMNKHSWLINYVHMFA